MVKCNTKHSLLLLTVSTLTLLFLVYGKTHTLQLNRIMTTIDQIIICPLFTIKSCYTQNFFAFLHT